MTAFMTACLVEVKSEVPSFGLADFTMSISS